jgi:hypothetical protein
MRMSLPSRAYGFGFGFALTLLAILAAVLLALALNVASARAAETCPNEARRAEDPYSAALPDCRAYEQVSPVEKNFGDVFGGIESVRVAPSGDAATFGSYVPLPVSVGSFATSTTYVASREAQGWFTLGLEPRAEPDAEGPLVVAVTEDLKYSFVLSRSEPPLAPEATEGRVAVYLRDDNTGVYRLLFQLTPEQADEAGEEPFKLVAGADEDSRIFFESQAQLLPEAPQGVPNLYEWHEGQITLLDVLPNGEPSSAGAAAGRFRRASGGALFAGGAVSEYGSRAVSEDGSRVFFTDLGTGALYVREPQADSPRTVVVSEGVGSPAWLAATPSGAETFYSEPSEFTIYNEVSVYRAGALYRFDVEVGSREALTPTDAGVLGIVGIGGEGSYVYFVAEAALAHGASAGEANLYLWHEGATSFIATLDRTGEGSPAAEDSQGDSWDWSPREACGGEGYCVKPSSEHKSSRVSGDGRTLLFTSQRNLTGYDNAGHTEAYLYSDSASGGRLTCVSCEPSGAPASSNVFLYQGYLPSPVLPHGTTPERLPRNLSEDGSRVFFETEEALVPQATDGQLNVYEWEREGVGSCPASRGEGCLSLISSGASAEPSLFAGASANGEDVFFFTRQSLVGQDNDELEDLYDARVGGGIAAQNPSVPVAPCQGEACRPVQTPAPSLGRPVSQMFSGPGNLAPQPEVKPAVVKPKPKVKQKAKAKKKKARKQDEGRRPRAAKRSRRGRI